MQLVTFRDEDGKELFDLPDALVADDHVVEDFDVENLGGLGEPVGDAFVVSSQVGHNDIAGSHFM